MARQEFESALDAGNLEVAMANGRWWRVRRNGKTQTWKTRPHDFRTPCKAGLKATFQVTQDVLARGDVVRLAS